MVNPDAHSFGGMQTHLYWLEDSLQWIEYGKQIKFTAPLKPSSKSQPLVEKSCFECLFFCKDCLSGGTQTFSIVLLTNPWSVTDTQKYQKTLRSSSRGASGATSTVTTFISVAFSLLCGLSDIRLCGEIVHGRSGRHTEIHRNMR